MAKVMVTDDAGVAHVEIVTDQEEGGTDAICRTCNKVVIERDGFQDAVAAAEIHVDFNHTEA